MFQNLTNVNRHEPRLVVNGDYANFIAVEVEGCEGEAIVFIALFIYMGSAGRPFDRPTLCA